MKPFELFLYIGSTLSLWFGISIYGLEKYFRGSSSENSASKHNLLRRARRLLVKRPSRVRSGQTASSKTMISTLNNSRTVNLSEAEAIKFKKKLDVDYRSNIDLNYCMQNIGQYSNNPTRF